MWLVATVNILDNAVLQHSSSVGKNTSTHSATTHASILPMETSKGADPPFSCFFLYSTQRKSQMRTLSC